MKKKINNLKLQKSKAHGYRFTVGRVLQLAVALVFLVFVGRFLYIGISKTVEGQNLSQRTKQLYLRNQVLKANRGTIYDRNGLVIAEDSHLYTVYAILDKSSINYKNQPEYVVNKEKTAQKLSTVLPLSDNQILKYLNPKHPAFQVQFGTAGSGLNKRQKEKIDAMKLPGIKFLETPSRLYPNGTFASHVVGLAQPEYSKKDGLPNIVGTMGLEAWFNKTLTGKDGHRESSVDASENQTPTKPQNYKSAVDGNNLYLTLDSQLQSLLEDCLSEAQAKYNPVSMTAIVEDMKTGKILAASQRPTFNPQTKKGLTKSFRNILIQDTYEPGSVFKILTLAAAVNSGNYHPNQYFNSGSVRVGGATIHDWLTSGWGSIPLSQAFPHSSNVGFVHIEQDMGAKTWRKYLNRFQIGQKTGVTLPGEQVGLLSFRGPTDQAVTSFGQGVNVNVMQMMQAFSSLGNNGQMVKPQFVDKITNENGKVIQNYQIKKVGAPVYSKQTRKVLIKNMERVLNKRIGTGYAYKMSDVSLGVKTGTAQIARPKGGGYLTGDSNYIFSVVGVTPTKNPRYCVYLTLKQPRRMSDPAEKILASIFKPVMRRVVIMSKSEDNDSTIVETPKLKGMAFSKAQAKAKSIGLSVEKIGDGDKIVAQGVSQGQKLSSGSKVLLLTKSKIKCPNMKNWTLEELHQFSDLTGIKLKIEGSGIVKTQSIKPDAILKSGQKIKIYLKE